MDLPALQKRLGLTQAQFAAVLGISVPGLKLFITGRAFTPMMIVMQCETLTRLLKVAVVARRRE